MPAPAQFESPLLPHTRRSLALNWWPALAWVCVLLVESTDMASANNTDGLLYGVISFVNPHVAHSTVDALNEVLRKSGHFLGYGLLSVLVFFALRNTNRDRIRRLCERQWGMYRRDVWRFEWSFIGVMAAIGMATYDEIHQSFIPSRTGRWQDVILDTCGAITMQFVVYLLASRAIKRGVPRSPVLQANVGSNTVDPG